MFKIAIYLTIMCETVCVRCWADEISKTYFPDEMYNSVQKYGLTNNEI